MSDGIKGEVAEEGDPNIMELVDSADKKKCICRLCEKGFMQKAGLYNHMKRKHNMLVYTKATISCREEGCTFKCAMREKLQSHLVSAHNMPLAFSKLKFSSIKEFEEWREVFEKQEKCRFVKKSGTRIRRHTGERHTYLYCSRSGNFVSNSKGKRTKMKKVTCKISNYCTASIDCIEENNGSVVAKLCSTHYGHDPSVELLRLSKTDKANIADKLVQGVPRDVVLDNVRASLGADVDRIHFLTMKDIRNIERAYGIKGEAKQKQYTCGFTSVNEWVRVMESLGEESPIIFYKPKNQPKIIYEGDDCLDLGDFCVVMMTKGQQEILKKFGQNGVFYLTWMSICNGYDLSLLTLLVTDDLNEAFPVAYMVCSKITRNIEILFFKVIRDKMGSFCARAIMTDDKKSLFDAWCTVMGFVPYYLLSNRYVDADWRDRLITVSNEDVQCAVYEVLYSYLSCTDPTKFDENLGQFVKHLKQNEETLIFGMYFEVNYLHRVRMWAGCYDKKSVGVNEHLNLDAIYNELLGICNNKGKFAKLLEKTLQGLLKIVRDRQYTRTSKITRQAQELSHHHSVAMNIDLDAIHAIENRNWKIKSESSSLMFIVTRKTYECNSKCPLICSVCHMCAHMFECTCKVYNFDRTMCKHIHAVGRLFQKNMKLIDNIGLSVSAEETDGGTEETGANVLKDIPENKKLQSLNKIESEVKTNQSTPTNSCASAKKPSSTTAALPSSTVVQQPTTIETSEPTVSPATINAVKELVVVQSEIVEKPQVSGIKTKVMKLFHNLETLVKDVDDNTKLKNIFMKLKVLKKLIDSSEMVTDKRMFNDLSDVSIIKGKKGRKDMLKRTRGRPRKLIEEIEVNDNKNVTASVKSRAKPGRPRKSAVEVKEKEESTQQTVVAEIHEEPKANPSTSGTNVEVKEEEEGGQRMPKKRVRKVKCNINPEELEIKKFKEDEIIEDAIASGIRRSSRKPKKKVLDDEIDNVKIVKIQSINKTIAGKSLARVSRHQNKAIEKGDSIDDSKSIKESIADSLKNIICETSDNKPT